LQKNARPSISVVIVVYSGSDLLRLVLANLALQTIAHAIEVVLVTDSPEKLRPIPSDPHPFFSLTILETRTIRQTGAAKALGVEAARAPLVMFLEDHSFPDPGCAQAMLERHRQQEVAAVGPLMLNANPSSPVSWGTFLVFYGPWTGKRLQPQVHHLPANHSCYRREVLMAYGQQLADRLEVESVLHWDLIDSGERLYLDHRAKVYHLNFSSISPLVREYFLASRVFAANRAARWASLQRTIYAIGSALLPFLRWQRIVEQATDVQLEPQLLLRASPSLFLNLCAGAAGEMLGYLAGPGNAGERLVAFERQKRSGYSPADVAAAARLVATFASPEIRAA